MLDGLCLILLAAVFALAHPKPSAIIGISIFAVVIASNVPPLVWELVRGRQATPMPDASDVFS